MREFSVRTFGAAGDGRTLDTASIAAAARACREAGGGVIHFPPGDYLTGIFEVFARTTLRLDAGARLLGSPRWEDHCFENAVGGILFARDADAIRIEGEGVIDGNAPAFFQEGVLHGDPHRDYLPFTRQKEAYGSASVEHGPLKPLRRPGNLLVFAGCAGVHLEGITITGATYWTVHLADCEDAMLRNLRIENDPRHPNNDGIHLTTCRRVRIEDCHIATGDDAIAVTGFRDAAGEREVALGLRGKVGVGGDIAIRRCVLSSRSAAVRIGYGTNPLRGVSVEDVEIRDSNRGIGIFARQSAVEDVTLRNIRCETRLFHGDWWGRGEPLQISSVRFYGEPELFPIRNVRVEHFHAIGENGVHVYAEEPGALSGMELRDVSVRIQASPLFEAWGGNLDLRPARREIAVHEGGNAPLWAVHVGDLRCVDCCFEVDGDARPRFLDKPVFR